MHAALRHKARTGLAVLTLGVLASCATPPSAPPSMPPSESAAETQPSAAPGRLKPMAVRPLDVTDGDASWTIQPGDLIDVCVRQANADPDAVVARGRAQGGQVSDLQQRIGR